MNRPKVNMDPPHRGEVVTILEHGKLKYGWQWLEDESGYWWGAKRGSDFILQVENIEPDFPTRQWSENLGGGFTPKPRWDPLQEQICFSDRKR